MVIFQKNKEVKQWTRQAYSTGSVVEHKGCVYIAKWQTDDTDSPLYYEAKEDSGLSWVKKDERHVPSLQVHIPLTKKHVCLSKCLRACIMKKPVNCRCNTIATRRRSAKNNQNLGRYFHSCFKCDFFEWEN